MIKVGLVTGLKAEAEAAQAIARDAPDGDLRVLCAGPGLAAAAKAARALLDAGAQAIMSFGLAGGLSDAMRPGMLLLPRGVLDGQGRRLTPDGAARDTLAFALASVIPLADGDLVSTAEPVAQSAAKADLAARSGAIAVDMESAAVAEEANAAGVPFIVLRVIADPKPRTIPPAALAGMNPDGSVSPLRVLARLAVRPQDAPEIARLARDNQAAMRTLRRAARLALPLLLLRR